jgi:hypothetical protein
MSRGRCGIPRKTQRLAEKIMTPREEGPRAQAFALGGRGLELRLGLSRIFHPDQRRSKIQRALRGLILEPGRVRLLHQHPELSNRRVGTDYCEAGKLDPPARTNRRLLLETRRLQRGRGGASQCQWTYNEPLGSQNPLFNGSQTINISGTAKNGGFKCAGGILRLSTFGRVPAGSAGAVGNQRAADCRIGFRS